MKWRKEDSLILWSSGNVWHISGPDAKQPMAFTGTTHIRFCSSSFAYRCIVKVTGSKEVHQALLARLAGSFEL